MFFPRFFLDFGVVLEGLGELWGTILQSKKSPKRGNKISSIKLRFLKDLGTVLGRSWDGLGRVWGRFWEGFGKVWEPFGHSTVDASLLGFIGLCWALPGLVWLCLAWFGFAGLCWALLGFVGLCWSLLGFAGLRLA